MAEDHPQNVCSRVGYLATYLGTTPIWPLTLSRPISRHTPNAVITYLPMQCCARYHDSPNIAESVLDVQ